jgi:hypothetical protein
LGNSTGCPRRRATSLLEEEGLCFDGNQFASWDEVHKECTPGEGGIAGGSKDTYVKFPRDKDGKLDLVNGEYSTEDVTITRVKYNEEFRLSLGGAMGIPLDKDGNKLQVEGRVALAFIYSTCILLSIKDCGGNKFETKSRGGGSKNRRGMGRQPT